MEEERGLLRGAEWEWWLGLRRPDGVWKVTLKPRSKDWIKQEASMEAKSK